MSFLASQIPATQCENCQTASMCACMCTFTQHMEQNVTNLNTTHSCTLSKHDLLQRAELCRASIHFNYNCTFSHAGTKSREVTSLPVNPLNSRTQEIWMKFPLVFSVKKAEKGGKQPYCWASAPYKQKNKFQRGTARRRISQRYSDKGEVQV